MPQLCARSITRMPKRRTHTEPSPLGRRISTMISVRKTNASALARTAGLGRETVRHAMKGLSQTVSDATARAIAKALDVRTEWLLTGNGPIEPHEGPERPPPMPLDGERAVLLRSIDAAVLAEQWELARALTGALKGQAQS